MCTITTGMWGSGGVIIFLSLFLGVMGLAYGFPTGTRSADSQRRRSFSRDSSFYRYGFRTGSGVVLAARRIGSARVPDGRFRHLRGRNRCLRHTCRGLFLVGRNFLVQQLRRGTTFGTASDDIWMFGCRPKEPIPRSADKFDGFCDQIGSALRGGGGGGQQSRARKAQEQLLLEGLQELLSKFSAGPQRSGKGERAAHSTTPKQPTGGPRPSKTKRRRAKRDAQGKGLLSALERMVQRATTEKDATGDYRRDSMSILQKLERLIGAAREGKLDPGAKSPVHSDSAKPTQPRGQAPQRSGKPKAAPATTARASNADKGKGKGFKPVALVPAHWHATYVPPKEAVNKLFKVKTGENLVCGVLNDVPDGLENFALPQGATITIILATESKDANAVRAPALDARGTPKVCQLWARSFGKPQNFLSWTTKEAKPLPAVQESGVLRVVCMKDTISTQLWQDRSKNYKAAVKAWLSTLRIPQASIIDLFNPRRSECGNILSVNVRVEKLHVATIDRASGVSGFLARELPADGAPQTTFGSIKWMKQSEDETKPELLKRARQEAEKLNPCLGLAFSNTGSIGLRRTEGTCETSWRVSGLPKSVSIAQFASWLRDNDWANVAIDSIRRRTSKNGVSFIFRGIGPNKPGETRVAQAVATLEVPLANGETTFVDFEPFRPQSKPRAFRNLKDSGLAWDLPKPAPAKSATVQTADIVSKEDSVAKKQRTTAEGDAATAPVPKVEVLQKLGLSVISVPGDGACWFHSLAWAFKKQGRPAQCPVALRAQTVDHFKRKADVFEPIWDRMTPDGAPCSSFTDYQAQIGAPAAHAGELEILAAASRWNLRIAIVRPGKSTVVIGEGKSMVWVIYRNNHYEPLQSNDDPSATQARKTHVQEVDDCFKFAIKQVGPQRTWSLRGGGRVTSRRGSHASSARSDDSGPTYATPAASKTTRHNKSCASSAKSSDSGPTYATPAASIVSRQDKSHAASVKSTDSGPTYATPAASRASSARRNSNSGGRATRPSNDSALVNTGYSIAPEIVPAQAHDKRLRRIEKALEAGTSVSVISSGSTRTLGRLPVEPVPSTALTRVSRKSAPQLARQLLQHNAMAKEGSDPNLRPNLHDNNRSQVAPTVWNPSRPRKRPASAMSSAGANAWATSTLETATRLRGASTSLPWLCAPELLPHGIRCQRCARSWFGNKQQTQPVRFCKIATCLTYTGPRLPAINRNAALTQLGLLKPRTSRKASAAQRAQHMDLAIQPSKFDDWQCPLCDFHLGARDSTTDVGTSNLTKGLPPSRLCATKDCTTAKRNTDRAHATRMHLRAHGPAGIEVLRNARSSNDPIHKSTLGAFAASKAAISKRCTTQRADAAARIASLNAVLPPWTCQFQLHKWVSKGKRNRQSYQCDMCSRTIHNRLTDIKEARICSKATPDAREQAAQLTTAQRTATILELVHAVSLQDAERRRQRAKERANLLAHARRERHL